MSQSTPSQKSDHKSDQKDDDCYSPSLLSVDEALAKLLEKADAIIDTEMVNTSDALNRVLAQNVLSELDVPGYDNSAMDGYAINTGDCAAAGVKLKVSQRIPAGHTGAPLVKDTAARIFTGAPVPAGANAVVMQEHCSLDDDVVTINKCVAAGTNVRKAGEDIKKGSAILEIGTRLRAQEMGLSASVGLAQFSVYKKLRVAAFFTGDELVEPGKPLQQGQIYNSNRYTLLGLLQSLGCEIIDLGIVPDSLDATLSVLKKASTKADLVITSGGVSVGEEDYVRIALEQLGELTMWRIAMKPGKPVAFGEVNNALFLGLPGNPVSVFVTFLLFARPLIMKLQGLRESAPVYINAKADFDWNAGKRQEYLRARLDANGVTSIFPQQGSGVLSSASWANGLIEVLPQQNIASGDSIRFMSFKELL